jgi:CSLREA domain-containing protein
MSRQPVTPFVRASIFSAALIALIPKLVTTPSASADTTITVTSLADPAESGQCTLRDAILIANGGSSAPGDQCAASGSAAPYVIVFSTGLSGTIALDSELPAIESGAALTIDGPATSPGITIDGGGHNRLIEVNPHATLNLQYMTLAHGFSVSGGAISNLGSVSVTDSTFASNAATVAGGAISNDTIGSTLFVTNCTFSRNQADLRGGGIANESRNASATVTNSTFFDNRSVFGGGAIQQRSGTVSVKNSIFVHEPTSLNCAGAIEDGGYNLSDDHSCDFSAATSRNDVSASELDLDPAGLASNGGPTQTVALKANSIAVDAIPAASCTFPAGSPNPCPSTNAIGNQLVCDQRGQQRPDAEDGADGNCDIGAYEFQDSAVIDCDSAAANNPYLLVLPLVFEPEKITGVADKSGAFSISIGNVLENQPVARQGLVCRNAFTTNNDQTAWLRAGNAGRGNLLYSVGFTATDSQSGASCTGAVPVCVQDLRHRGQPCTGSPTFDATMCGK